MKAVRPLAIGSCGTHCLLVVGGIIELPYVAGLPREEPRRYLRRRPFADLAQSFSDPAPMFQHQAELSPEHMAVGHKVESDRDVTVRSESPFQCAAQIVDVGSIERDPWPRRGPFPLCRRLSEPGSEVFRVPLPHARGVGKFLVRIASRRLEQAVASLAGGQIGMRQGLLDQCKQQISHLLW